MIVPFAAGGALDALGRIIASRLGEILGRKIIIENVAGAGGMTGASRAAKAPPDGYVFVLGNVATHAMNSTLYKNALYNAATDFAPVVLIAETPQVLVARAELPVSNLQEFMRYAKANQAKMQCHSYSLSGRRPGDAGFDRWSNRLYVPKRTACDPAGPSQSSKSNRDIVEEPVVDLANSGIGAGAGAGRFRIQ
jgi:hypothetical protein